MSGSNWADRANMGLTPMQLQEKIGQVGPSLSEKQIINHQQNFAKKHKNRLKPKSVTAQKTTSRRSQYTVAKQFMWFKTYCTSQNSVQGGFFVLNLSS